MPLEIVKNDTVSLQIAGFIEQASQFWGLVRMIKISRKRRGAVGAFEQAAIVRHVIKDGEAIDESKVAVEQFIAIGRADADANGAADYKIELWGQREEGKKSRTKVVADDSQLLALTIRLGDGDADAQGEAGIMREVGALLPKQASGFAAAIDAADRALSLQTRVIEMQGKMIQDTYTIQQASAAQQVESMRLLMEDRRDVRKEEREREKEERDDTRDAAIEANRQQNLQALMGLLMFAAQIAAMKFAHETGTQAPTPPGAPPPAAGSLAPELNSIISSLSAEEAAKVQEIVGDRIWDLLKGAASAKSDDECRAILGGLKNELKSHPNGKMALMQLAAAIGQERMQRLISILTAAGLIT